MSEHATAHVDLADTWHFGDQQDAREERREIERAKAAGRAEDFVRAQAEARAVNAPRPKPRRPCGGARNLCPPSYGHASDPESYGNDLLGLFKLGQLTPVHIPVDDGLPPGPAAVARFAALFFGLRIAFSDDRRPAPLGAAWVADQMPETYAERSVRRALGELVKREVLTRHGSLPGRGGRKGTALYGMPGVTVSDGAPVAAVERGAVSVEREDVGGSGAALEPAGEPPQEPGVGGAVDRAAGALRGAVAPGRDTHAGSASVGLHVTEGYGVRPTPGLLLERALSHAGGPRERACWLAVQLRDNGFDEWAVAYEVLAAFTGAMPASFTLRDAESILAHVYSSPAREPWSSARGIER